MQRLIFGGYVVAGRQDPVSHLFGGLVPDEVIAAYAKLLSVGGVPKAEAADLLGGADLVRKLERLGMARVIADMPDGPARFQAAPMVLALQAVLSSLQAGALKQQQLLLDGHERLREAQLLPVEFDGGDTGHLVRIVTDRKEIARLSTCMINSAHRDWMTLETAETDIPLSEDHHIRCPEGLREQVRIRSIYDAAILTNPGARRNLQLSLAAGEEARIFRQVLIKMQLADENVVMLPLTPTGTGGVLIIYAATITRAMRAYFEMLWNLATPFGGAEPPQGSPITTFQRDIIRLLLLGQAEDAIARNLGKSEKTVHRSIEALYAMTGAKGRFALGATVAQRGWLNTDKETHA